MALALVLWAPMGISHGDMTMLTGHSTFYNGAGYDPCLGSVAGILRNRVMWFNDQVLVETYGGRGTFIYLTEAGAPDPRQADAIYTEGVFYDFVDPNGAHWHIDEAFYNVNLTTPSYTIETAPPGVHQKDPILTGDRYMTWIVELAARPIYDDFAGADPHTFYNFLIIADTCKMHNATSTYDGEEIHDIPSGKLNDDYGHPNGDLEHQHGRWMVDLWIGKRPVLVPMGVTAETVTWESEWAQGEAEQRSQDQTPYDDMPELP